MTSTEPSGQAISGSAAPQALSGKETSGLGMAYCPGRLQRKDVRSGTFASGLRVRPRES
jgi:hypothetical protein